MISYLKLSLLLLTSFALDGSLRRRLVSQNRIDDKVNEVFGEDKMVDLTLWYTGLELGEDAKERCHFRGLAFCETLGASLPEYAINCDSKTADPDFVYLGPSVLEEDSVYFCAEFINDVDPTDIETMEKLVTLVEDDENVHISGNFPDGIEPLACVNSETDVWHLRSLGEDEDNFYYDENDGTGVTVYVIDTGVNGDHPDFEGRVVGGMDFTDHEFSTEDWSDFSGHGTHVAGTIAGKSFGVARKAEIFAVRVFSPIDEWPYALFHMQGFLTHVVNIVEKVLTLGEKAVINMSFGGPKNSAVNEITKMLVVNGITVVTAAGNEHMDACEISPASTEETITVGAAGRNWRTGYHETWPFSNWGSCVNIMAPGVDIWSPIGSHGYTRGEGTSMAAPHVAGVVAQIISRTGNTDPGFIRDELLQGNYGKYLRLHDPDPNTIVIGSTRYLASSCELKEDESCGKDIWNPGWGDSPLQRCEKWWQNGEWGADFDCSRCESVWAQSECRATCCRHCPADLPTCDNPHQDFSIDCGDTFWDHVFGTFEDTDCGPGCLAFQTDDSNCVNECCAVQKAYCKDDFKCMHDRNCGLFNIAPRGI